MKTFKKIFALLFSFSFFINYSVALGAPDMVSETSVVNEIVSPVSLNIADIKTDKKTYKPGETIKGSFILENHSEFAVHNLSFRTEIASNYEELAPGYKIAKNFLDASSRRGPIDLGIGKSQLINFSYTIPQFISGEKLGVEIEIFSEAGHLINFKGSDYISIEKTGPSLIIKNVEVLLSNGFKSNNTEGPTIYKDKEPSKAFVDITISNTSKNPINIVPDLKVYEQSNIEKVQKIKLASQAISANKDSVIRIDLPTMSYEPGVYMAEILLRDEKGNQIATLIAVRYIIGGNIATIHNAYTDKSILARKEIFNFFSTITGKPFDIAILRGNGDFEKNTIGKIEVRIFNEKNNEVASFSDDFNMVGETSIKRELSAKKTSRALRIEMDIFDDQGLLLNSYRENLSDDFDKVASEIKNSNQLLSIIWIVGLVIVLVVIFWFIRRKKQLASTLIMFLVASAIFSVGDQVSASCASAYVNIYPSTPYNGQYFESGEVFYATGSIGFSSCDNSDTNVGVRVRMNDQVSSGLASHVGTVGGSGWTGRNDTFVRGPFYAPSTNGTYSVNYFAHSVAGACTTDASSSVYIGVLNHPTPPVIPVVVPTPVSGVCGSANGLVKITSWPDSSTYCSAGSVSNGSLSNTGVYSWLCLGTDGGSNASCSLTTNMSVNTETPVPSVSVSGGCPNGTYYCEIVSQCLSLSKSCNSAVAEEYFELNPNIKADKIGSVSLKGLFSSPSIGNPGYSCKVDWSDKVFASYDYFTRCTFTDSNTTTKLEFSPGSTTAPTSYTVDNIIKDTLLKMSCVEIDSGEIDSEEAVCRINWNYKEVN